MTFTQFSPKSSHVTELSDLAVTKSDAQMLLGTTHKEELQPSVNFVHEDQSY